MLDLPSEVKENLARIGDDVEGVLNDAATISQVSDAFITQAVKNIIFFGKSLALWEDEMVVAIPHGELAPDEIRALHVELANKTQIASHYYEEAKAAHAISSGAVHIKRADLVTALVTHYVSTGQSTPPATVMEKLVDGCIRRMSSISTMNKIAKDFWHGKLDTLEKVSNQLSKISMSTVTEMKYLGSET